MSAILVVNTGSTSRKYALYFDGVREFDWEAEVAADAYQLCTKRPGAQLECEPISTEQFSALFTRIAHEVRDVVAERATILEAVAVRVMVPGSTLQAHHIVDTAYMQALQAREPAAPLHVPMVVRAIQSAQHHFPTVPVVAVSDSAFHSTLSSATRSYSLPADLVQKHDIFRFGYHGFSVSSIVNRVHAVAGIDPERMIVCHVGDSVSVTAVRSGKSVDTSMGFSAATGLVMGSRGGDVDAAALVELMRAERLRPTDTELLLTARCGLVGICGEADLRTVLARKISGDTTAAIAIERYVAGIRKEIGAMMAVLGGVDMIVFTASAGVRSSELRAMVLEPLRALGIHLSEDRNAVTISKDGVITERNSPIKVVVMRTDEMSEMATAAASTLRVAGK